MGFTFWIYENKVNLSSVTHTPLDPPRTQTCLTDLSSHSLLVHPMVKIITDNIKDLLPSKKCIDYVILKMHTF